MSVKVTMLGRLGNNLFQYALGRIVAERHGLAFHCLWPQATRGSLWTWLSFGQPVDSGPTVKLRTVTQHFPNAPLDIPGREVEVPVDSFEQGMPGHVLDLASILEDRRLRQIKLRGLFQRYEYFESHADEIRHWFQIAGAEVPYRIQPSDVLVHVRRGFDFGAFGWTLAMSYYQRVLARLGGIGKVYVCGTCIDDDVRHALATFQPIYIDADSVEVLALMSKFRRIVLSNSSFAWWGAFLSDAEEIYAPRSPDGQVYAFTGYQDVDLHMRQPRYREITDVKIVTFTPLILAEKAPASVDDESRRLLQWMADLERPASLAEFREQHGRGDSDARRTLKRMLDAGVVAIVNSYLPET
jgi:hypothetical protein